MKIAILNILTNPVIKETNIRSIKLLYMKKHLAKKYNADVNIIGMKNKNNIKFNYFKDYKDIKLKDYDKILIHSIPLNFYGGCLKPHTITLLKQLAQFQGEVFIFLMDPAIGFYNYARKIYEKRDTLTFMDDLRLTIEEVETLESRPYIFLCDTFDYELFSKNYQHKKYLIEPAQVIRTNIMHEIFKDLKTFKDQRVENKEYDIMYYGSDRRGYRHRKIENYFLKGNYSKCLIGIKKIKHEDIQSFGYMKPEELIKHMNKARLTLVIGDKEHENNFLTARYFEGLQANSLAVIDLAYDTNKIFLDDPLLKEYCYVENSDDIEHLLFTLKQDPYLYKRLVEKQQEELKSKLEEKI